VPEYWEWLEHLGLTGKVKIPLEIYEEIKDGPADKDKDLLYAWIQEARIKKAMVFEEDVDAALVQHVVENGYGDDLSDDEIEEIGRDPFLIAYAFAKPTERCVVTSETSQPGKKRQNRKVPDVCDSLNVKRCNPFELNKALGFSTKWKK